DIFDVLVASDHPNLKSDIQTPKSKVQSRQNTEGANARKNPARKNEELAYKNSNVNVAAPAPSSSPVATATFPRIPASRPLPVDYSALLGSYRAIVVGGHIEWSTPWIQRITEYVKSGGTVVLNAAQIKN